MCSLTKAFCVWWLWEKWGGPKPCTCLARIACTEMLRFAVIHKVTEYNRLAFIMLPDQSNLFIIIFCRAPGWWLLNIGEVGIVGLTWAQPAKKEL